MKLNVTLTALLIGVFALSLEALAQQPKSPEFKVEAGLFVYEKIEPVELTQKEIVAYAAAFFAQKFRSSKSVIELRDDDLGKLVGDVVLKNPNAGMFDAFKEIKTRLILDAKEGKYRLQATNIAGIDGNGNVPKWGQIESANQYRLEPLALQVLPPFAEELKSYLVAAKSARDF